MTEYPAISQLMPHGEPMVLLDRLVEWAPGSAECAMQVRADAPFVEDGALRSAFMIEHMAQTVAVCLGYEAFLGGEGARVGMIVACKKIEIHEDSVPVGEPLSIRANRLLGSEASSHFECEVRHPDGTPVSSGTLTLYYGEMPED